jgi:hypothetical protein
MLFVLLMVEALAKVSCSKMKSLPTVAPKLGNSQHTPMAGGEMELWGKSLHFNIQAIKACP